MEARTSIGALIAAAHRDVLELIEFEDVLATQGKGKRVYACVREPSAGVEGHGDAETRDEAWTRAYGEWCERSALRFAASTLPSSSSGFAAHVDFKRASVAATHELIEHDAAISCWLAQEAPTWIRDEATLVGFAPWARVVQIELAAHGIELDVGLQAITGNVVTAVALGRLRFGGGGLFVTSGAATGVSEAIERAVREARRTANALVTRKRLGLPLARPVAAHALGGPEDHRDFWLCSGAMQDIGWFLAGASDVAILEDFAVSVARVELPFVPAMRIAITHASSSDAQQMFWGAPDSASIAHERLRKIAGSGAPVCRLPHPYA